MHRQPVAGCRGGGGRREGRSTFVPIRPVDERLRAHGWPTARCMCLATRTRASEIGNWDDAPVQNRGVRCAVERPRLSQAGAGVPSRMELNLAVLEYNCIRYSRGQGYDLCVNVCQTNRQDRRQDRQRNARPKPRTTESQVLNVGVVSEVVIKRTKTGLLRRDWGIGR